MGWRDQDREWGPGTAARLVLWRSTHPSPRSSGPALVAALGLGWIGGWSSYRHCRPHGIRRRSRRSPIPLPAALAPSTRRVRLNASEPAREASPAAQPVRKIGLPPATKPARSPDERRAQPSLRRHPRSPVSSSPAQHTSILARRRPRSNRQSSMPKRAPVPETKPTTIEGWTVREVAGNAAVLEGPNGVLRARPGDTVPGVGRVDSIVRWGSRWIVATSSGLISTQ